MAEQGLLEYVEMERKGARCERMCSQVRLLGVKTFKTVQIPYIHYDMSQRWPLGYMMIQTCDL